MEESKPAQATAQDSNPPATGQTLPPQPPPADAALPPKSKKRPLESDAHLQNSSIFKIRAIIIDLRPRFIEVLRTPDFQNCKASNEIREQLKVLVELCKQMGAEVASLGKSNNVQDGKSSYGENTDGKTTPKQPGEDGLPQGTYIVGGSAFGWNFITYSGQEPVYYGVTKEDFRAKYPGPWFVSN